MASGSTGMNNRPPLDEMANLPGFGDSGMTGLSVPRLLAGVGVVADDPAVVLHKQARTIGIDYERT